MKYKLWLTSALLVTNLLWAADSVEEIDEAFLAFLGQWETDDGEWLPPDELEKLAIPVEDGELVEQSSGLDDELLTKEHEIIDEYH